jgi:membrane protease YdiL (CAAX protease family)
MALIMVIIITFLVVLAIGVAISIPLFGRGILDQIAFTTNYDDITIVSALKYFQIVNQVGVFIAPAFLFVILTDEDITGYMGLKGHFRRFSTIFGFIVLIVSLPFISWIVDLNGAMHFPDWLSGVENWMRDAEDKAESLTNAFLATSSWGGFLVNLFMIAGLAAVGEELIFRGILVRLFREWTRNVHLAVIIPAFLFSALHLQFYGFFGRLILGMILGYLFVWSGSLWVPVIVHFLNNAMAVFLSFLHQRGSITSDLESFGSTQNGYIIGASFALMIFTMSIIYLHEKAYFKKKRLS